MDLWERVKASGAGEPGFYFTNDKDYGCNPCCEIAPIDYNEKSCSKRTTNHKI